MSIPIFNAKIEDLDTAQKRGKYTVCTVGCGQVGILHAALFADAGFKVICVDADQTVVNNIAKGKAPFSGSGIESKMKGHIKAGRLIATNDIKKAVSESDIVAVTIPARIDSKKKVDYSNIEGICKRIGAYLKVKSLVIIMKLVGVGTVEGMIKEALENSSGFKVGTDLGLAYSPFQSSLEEELDKTTDRSRIVAATDRNSLNAASTVLELIAEGKVKKTGNMKAAETATLFQIQQQDVSVALANELAFFCEKLGVDYLEVYELLRSSVAGLMSPPSLSNKNAQEEPYLLLADAENLNVKLRIPVTARDINEQATKHGVNLVKDALRTCGKTPRRARISLLGVSQKPNTKSRPKRLVKQIAQVLASKGARIRLYDPYFSEGDLGDMKPHFKKSFVEALEDADCMVILTAHDQFRRLNLNKLKIIMKKPSAIVDLEGIIDPAKAEKEGFIYRGLGRGVWTK